eukprot:TRINITY_DN22_c0_g1_i1.p1 TRINITY_DN22_c0_g1~~TRINITY_DN22_c0_g1_i1.p1  ORF type:complete len:697 (-),score=130.01 TRINITY_DN22_c0_g1_i1:386-2476(-)
MPVSAALLVANGPGGQDLSRGGQNFNRGEKGTSSVRLRKRRDDVNQPGRRKNRHSGDFSFFSPRKEEVVKDDDFNRLSDKSDSEGDWNYITFPNGVPIVQEVKIGMDATKENGPTPVKVTMREVPAMTPVKPRSNLNSSRAVSASVMNIQEQHIAQRKSGDFSHFNSHDYTAVNGEIEDPNVRRRPHARSHSQQPIKTSNTPEQTKQIRAMHASGQSHAYLHVTPTRTGNPKPKKEGNNVTKRCSGEFEFKKINRRSGDFNHLSQVLAQELDKAEEQTIVERMISRELHGDSGSEGSEESGIFSTGSSQESPRKEVRRPGLGRRAITQVNMRDRTERKNSYNHALAKSQENLVKISSDSGAEDVFEQESTSIKKGLLWQQRDKLFSRWKERYFILTKDLLQCFKKETSKITEMGGFIFKIKLSEVEAIELLDKRGYLTICINLQREGKVYLRRTEGIRDWYEAIRENMQESRARRNNRTSAIFADRRQNTDSSGMENWMAQKRLGKMGFSDSTPEVNKVGEKDRITLDELSNLYKNEELEQETRREEDSKTKLTKKINRLSLLSDIELPDSQNSDLGIDLEKGIFLRRNRGDTDSGNNSLNTNRSSSSTGTASSKLSQPMESSFMEEDEEDYSENLKMSPDIRITKPQINKNIIEVRYRERSSTDAQSNRSPGSNPPPNQERRRSQHVNRLQITHV